MQMFGGKGKRIRVSDKTLVFHSVFLRFLGVFLLVMLLFHLKTIIAYDWTDFSLLHVDGSMFDRLDIPYLILSVCISLIVCGVVIVIWFRLRRNNIIKLNQRQLIAKMFLDNKWYDADAKSQESFFKGLGSSKSIEKITYFPTTYYKLEDGLIYITVRITMGPWQEHLLRLQKKFETGLLCELLRKTTYRTKILGNSYVQYVLIGDMQDHRISINDVTVQGGRMQLMKMVFWEFDKMPHMLISGGTGSGKTYFILTLVRALIEKTSSLFILDPKNADLADLGIILPNVFHEPEDIISCINAFCEGMLQRSSDMKQLPDYKTGGNYASLGLKPCFLIFDEYVAFMEMLNRNQTEEVLGKLKQISMLGRQAGYFLILACQRPDAKYLSDGIRDQFHFRLALGRNSELGYKMMFGECDKVFTDSEIKGRGYVDTSEGFISEFYSPLIPSGYDFMTEIRSAYSGRDTLPDCMAESVVSGKCRGARGVPFDIEPTAKSHAENS